MIVIAEFNYRGNVHEMVNSCMVGIMHRIFPDEQILLMGENALVTNLSRLCPEADLQTAGLPQGGAVARTKAIWKILSTARRNRARCVLLLSALPVGGALLRVIKWFFPQQQVIAVLHGELEHLRRHRGEPTYRLGRLLRFALNADRRTRFIVLGESIKRNLLQLLPSLDSGLIIAIDHPYRYPTLPIPQADTSVDFVQFGVGSFSKGSHHLFNSARLIHEKVSPESRFYLAGGVYPEMEPYLDANVTYPAPGSNLTREQIDQIAAHSDYALFYYTNEHYKLCASGAFFDAVRYGLPIICLRNDFFNWYFERYGDLGYLFDTVEELDETLASLVGDFPAARHATQAANVRSLRDKLSMENITLQLKNQIGSIFDLQ